MLSHARWNPSLALGFAAGALAFSLIVSPTLLDRLYNCLIGSAWIRHRQFRYWRDEEVEMTNETLIGVGIFTCVHRISKSRVRKIPRGKEECSKQAIRTEAHIYALLGDHPRIVRCLSAGHTEEYVDLEWAANGNLDEYIKKNRAEISDSFRMHVGRQMIDSVHVLHRQSVIHSDLHLGQWLLDVRWNARLCDFGASSYPGQDALGMENASHFLPRDDNTPSDIRSDLFALGSSLYQLMVGESPYFGRSDEEIESLYGKGMFPAVKDILCGSVVLSCWEGEFDSAVQALDAYDRFMCDYQENRLLPFAICRKVLTKFLEARPKGWKG